MERIKRFAKPIVAVVALVTGAVTAVLLSLSLREPTALTTDAGEKSSLSSETTSTAPPEELTTSQPVTITSEDSIVITDSTDNNEPQTESVQTTPVMTSVEGTTLPKTSTSTLATTSTAVLATTISTLVQVPTTQATTAPIEQAEQSASTDFKVVAYYPSWSGNQLDKLRFDILTHVIYAFAIPTSDGGLMPLDNPTLAEKVVEKAHSNGAKALLAVGGWSYNDSLLESVFVSATATDEKLYAFGDAIVKMCVDYGFDGIDIDWEHPRISNGSYKRYEKLMLYLNSELDKRGKLLTSAVVGGTSVGGYVLKDSSAHTDAVLDAVDWINVMAYDGGTGKDHSPYTFAEYCGNYWLNTRGVESDKVVLGVAFYASPTVGYSKLLSAVPDAYLSDSALYNGQTVYYCGMSTMQRKTRLALDNYGGIMIWEITYDTTDTSKSLLTAIANELAK